MCIWTGLWLKRSWGGEVRNVSVLVAIGVNEQGYPESFRDATDLWQQIIAGFIDPIPNSEIKPNPNTARIYDKLIKKYAKCERETLRKMK